MPSSPSPELNVERRRVVGGVALREDAAHAQPEPQSGDLGGKPHPVGRGRSSWLDLWPNLFFPKFPVDEKSETHVSQTPLPLEFCVPFRAFSQFYSLREVGTEQTGKRGGRGHRSAGMTPIGANRWTVASAGNTCRIAFDLYHLLPSLYGLSQALNPKCVLLDFPLKS